MARPKKSLLDRMKEAFPNLDTEHPPPVLKKERHPDSFVIEAESVLLYFNLKGAGFTKQICPQCEEEFAYKYTVRQGKLCCSDECRKAELAKIGIDWEPLKPPEERWGFRSFGELPAIVSPKVLSHLDKILESEESHRLSNADDKALSGELH